jgi:hypothetical protein
MLLPELAQLEYFKIGILTKTEELINPMTQLLIKPAEIL